MGQVPDLFRAGCTKPELRLSHRFLCTSARALQKHRQRNDFLVGPHWSRSTAKDRPQIRAKFSPGLKRREFSLAFLVEWEEAVHVHVHRNEDQQAGPGSVFPSFILLPFSTLETCLVAPPQPNQDSERAGWCDKAHTELQPPRPNRRLSASPSPRRRRRSTKNANTPFFSLFDWLVPSPRSPSLHLADPNYGGNPEPISPACACTCARLSELHVHVENSPLCL